MPAITGSHSAPSTPSASDRRQHDTLDKAQFAKQGARPKTENRGRSSQADAQPSQTSRASQASVQTSGAGAQTDISLNPKSVTNQQLNADVSNEVTDESQPLPPPKISRFAIRTKETRDRKTQLVKQMDAISVTNRQLPKIQQQLKGAMNDLGAMMDDYAKKNFDDPNGQPMSAQDNGMDAYNDLSKHKQDLETKIDKAEKSLETFSAATDKNLKYEGRLAKSTAENLLDVRGNLFASTLTSNLKRSTLQSIVVGGVATTAQKYVGTFARSYITKYPEDVEKEILQSVEDPNTKKEILEALSENTELRDAIASGECGSLEGVPNSVLERVRSWLPAYTPAPNVAATMPEAATEITTAMPEAATEITTAIPEATTGIATTISEAATGITTAIPEAATEITTAIPEATTGIATTISEAATETTTAPETIDTCADSNAFINGITDRAIDTVADNFDRPSSSYLDENTSSPAAIYTTEAVVGLGKGVVVSALDGSIEGDMRRDALTKNLNKAEEAGKDTTWKERFVDTTKSTFKKGIKPNIGVSIASSAIAMALKPPESLQEAVTETFKTTLISGVVQTGATAAADGARKAIDPKHEFTSQALKVLFRTAGRGVTQTLKAGLSKLGGAELPSMPLLVRTTAINALAIGGFKETVGAGVQWVTPKFLPDNEVADKRMGEFASSFADMREATKSIPTDSIDSMAQALDDQALGGQAAGGATDTTAGEAPDTEGMKYRQKAESIKTRLEEAQSDIKDLGSELIKIFKTNSKTPGIQDRWQELDKRLQKHNPSLGYDDGSLHEVKVETPPSPAASIRSGNDSSQKATSSGNTGEGAKAPASPQLGGSNSDLTTVIVDSQAEKATTNPFNSVNPDAEKGPNTKSGESIEMQVTMPYSESRRGSGLSQTNFYSIVDETAKDTSNRKRRPSQLSTDSETTIPSRPPSRSGSLADLRQTLGLKLNLPQKPFKDESKIKTPMDEVALQSRNKTRPTANLSETDRLNTKAAIEESPTKEDTPSTANSFTDFSMARARRAGDTSQNQTLSTPGSSGPASLDSPFTRFATDRSNNTEPRPLPASPISTTLFKTGEGKTESSGVDETAKDGSTPSKTETTHF